MAAPKSKKAKEGKREWFGRCTRWQPPAQGGIKMPAHGRARRASVAWRAEDARRAHDDLCVCKAQRAFGPSLLVLRFLAVPVFERVIHILRMSFVPCGGLGHLSLPILRLLHNDTRDRSVLEVVEYVFYAVPALVVEYVIPAVACVIREHDDGACESCSPAIGFESVYIFNDIAHDVRRPSHLRAVPLR